MNKKDFYGLLNLANSPLVEHVKQKDAQKHTPPTKDVVSETHIDIIVDGREKLTKYEFHIVCKQLTAWGILHSGAVIKHEGPRFVKMAVEITKQNLDKIRSPKAYFRGVLKNLQEAAMENLHLQV